MNHLPVPQETLRVTVNDLLAFARLAARGRKTGISNMVHGEPPFMEFDLFTHDEQGSDALSTPGYFYRYREMGNSHPVSISPNEVQAKSSVQSVRKKVGDNVHFALRQALYQLDHRSPVAIKADSETFLCGNQRPFNMARHSGGTSFDGKLHLASAMLLDDTKSGDHYRIGYGLLPQPLDSGDGSVALSDQGCMDFVERGGGQAEPMNLGVFDEMRRRFDEMFASF